MDKAKKLQEIADGVVYKKVDRLSSIMYKNEIVKAEAKARLGKYSHTFEVLVGKEIEICRILKPFKEAGLDTEFTIKSRNYGILRVEVEILW